MSHTWTKDDDIIGYYLYRFGDKELEFTKQELAESLGMGWNSMALKIANYKAIDEKGGMSGFSRQAKQVYDLCKNMTDNDFAIVGLEAIVRNYTTKLKQVEDELAKRRSQ